MSMPQQLPQQQQAQPRTLTIKDLTKKLEISSIDFVELVRQGVAHEGKASFLVFDQFASRINFLDDKVSMRMRAYNRGISDLERKLYDNCKKQIKKHRTKLVSLFSTNLNQRTKELKQMPVTLDPTEWAVTVKCIKEVYLNGQQIAKRGGFSDNPNYVEALKKFEQQVAKTILTKCILIMGQKENVQEKLTEQYAFINATPLSNQVREELKEEINKNYRKAFNENFKPS